MSYFAKYPLIVYPLTNDGKTLVPYTLTDIMSRVIFDMPERDLISISQEYMIEPGETIETVSNNVYGTPYYHWTIMFINNIFDYTDWYMSPDQLNDYCVEKYGADNLQNVSYYTDEFGNVIKSNSSEALTVFNNRDFGELKYTDTLIEITNYQHESKLNDEKQIIRVIRPEYINEFIINFSNKIKEAL